jgi:hypothetical protein
MEQLNDKDVGPVLEETDWTMPGLERQSWPQPYVQGLLGPMEVSHIKGWHTGAPLVVTSRWSKIAQIVLRQSKVCQTPLWTVRRAPGFQQDPGQGEMKTLLAPGKKQCWEVSPALWHLHSQLWSANQGPRPYASVRQGPIWEDSHRCCRSLPS